MISVFLDGFYCAPHGCAFKVNPYQCVLPRAFARLERAFFIAEQ